MHSPARTDRAGMAGTVMAVARITGAVMAVGRMAGIVTAAAETIGTVMAAVRITGTGMAVGRMAAAGMAGLQAVTREAATDRTADSTRTGEEMVEMEDPRATDKVDIREAAGQVMKAVRVTAGVRAAARAVTAVITVRRAMAEAMADREIDSEIISRAKALQQRLLEKMWKRGARRRRGVQAARRKTSAPGKITSTRRTRH